MVGAGEVDEDLEVETKEECEKYGKVGKCVIFEVRDNLSLFGCSESKLGTCPSRLVHYYLKLLTQKISQGPLLCWDSGFSVRYKFLMIGTGQKSLSIVL